MFSFSNLFSILAAMKEAKMLDVSGDGRIDVGEFERLMDPEVIAAADAKMTDGFMSNAKASAR